MTAPARSEPYEEALRASAAFLNALPVPSMLIGGLAVIAHGHVRTTDDIDATVSAQGISPEQIVELARAQDIHPRIEDAIAFARRNQVILLIHRPTGIELDLSLAWLPFEEQALARSVVIRFRGLELRVCDLEDLIVYKVVAARPVDIEDARQLSMRHHARIDRDTMTRRLAEFDELLDDGQSRVAIWHGIERSAFRNA